MSAIIIENGLVHYEALGRGKPIVFLHGWLGSWRYWMPTMEAVSDRYRTYAFDLWGFGDSEKLAQRYEIEAYASLIGEFVDRLVLAEVPVVLVGHALGAVAAILFAIRNPARVDRVMTVSLPLNGTAINRKLGAGGSGDAVLDRIIGRKQAQQGYPDVAMEADKADSNAIAATARALSNADLRGDLETISRPLLMVHGDKDSLVSPPASDAIRSMDDGQMRQIVIKDTTHFPMLDEAARFQRLLRDFLESDLATLELKDEWKRRAR